LVWTGRFAHKVVRITVGRRWSVVFLECFT
jgi:hypothetical protein